MSVEKNHVDLMGRLQSIWDEGATRKGLMRVTVSNLRSRMHRAVDDYVKKQERVVD